MAELAAWDSFYVIVGSAAGALIGLQFVVITLIAQRATIPAPEASAAFGTPTIVHFGAALLLSALVRAPLKPMVGATNKSMAAMSGVWLRRKVRQGWEGSPCRLTMYLAMLD